MITVIIFVPDDKIFAHEKIHQWLVLCIVTKIPLNLIVPSARGILQEVIGETIDTVRII